MLMRRLGRSGLKVSEVGLGCNSFGARMDSAQADAVVGAALDVGVNLFDTADYYGATQSEGMLGKALGKRRHEAVIATKFGMPLPDQPASGGGSRRWIMRAVEGSLKRLGTDYIDLYQHHLPDPHTPIDETLRALDDLVAQGKVRYVGSSNMMAWRIAEADWIARSEHLTRFVSVQNNFSLLAQDALAETAPACEHYGIGFLPYFPLARGLLTGKYKRGEAPAAGTRLAKMGETPEAAKLARVEVLEAWAQARGHSVLELAFAWLLAQGVVSSVIAGASNPEQMRANVAAADWVLTPEEAAEAAELARA